MSPRVEFRGSPESFRQALGPGALMVVLATLLITVGWVRWALDSILWISAGLALIAGQLDALVRLKRKVTFLLVVDSEHIMWSWSDGRGASAKIPLAQIRRVTLGWESSKLPPSPRAGLNWIEIESMNGWIEVVPREFFWRDSRLAEAIRARLPAERVCDVASPNSS